MEVKRYCKDSIELSEFRNLLARGNHFFDLHTGVQSDDGYCLETYLKRNGDIVFPSVLCTEKGIFLRETGDKILSVNGISTEEILKEVREKLGVDMNPEYIYSMLSFSLEFQTILMCKNITPPFSVEMEGQYGKKSVLKVQGANLRELQESLQKKLSVFFKNGPYDFEIHPEVSMAIIRFYVCDTVGLKSFFSNCFKEIKQEKIKNIFVDVSLNGGGTTQACELLFEQLNFDSKMEIVVSQKEGGTLRSQRLRYNKRGRGEYSGNIYVFQSFLTVSSGTVIGEVLKSSRKAVLVGTRTGGCVPVYTDKENFELSNSRIEVYCARQYYNQTRPQLQRDQDGFLLPDIFYPFGLDRQLELSDCIEIISLNKQ